MVIVDMPLLRQIIILEYFTLPLHLFEILLFFLIATLLTCQLLPGLYLDTTRKVWQVWRNHSRLFPLRIGSRWFYTPALLDRKRWLVLLTFTATIFGHEIGNKTLAAKNNSKTFLFSNLLRWILCYFQISVENVVNKYWKDIFKTGFYCRVLVIIIICKCLKNAFSSALLNFHWLLVIVKAGFIHCDERCC